VKYSPRPALPFENDISKCTGSIDKEYSNESEKRDENIRRWVAGKDRGPDPHGPRSTQYQHPLTQRSLPVFATKPCNVRGGETPKFERVPGDFQLNTDERLMPNVAGSYLPLTTKTDDNKTVAAPPLIDCLSPSQFVIMRSQQNSQTCIVKFNPMAGKFTPVNR
jgi:hypothetical protein